VIPAAALLSGALLVATPGTQPTAAGARDGELSALRENVARILERNGVSGAGLAVVAPGLRWAGGVGVADRTTGAPVTDRTVFRAGSITKSLVALAVMRLVERGQLSLGAPVASLLPEAGLANPWEASRPLTVAHLLEHTAGFEFLRWNEWFDDRPEPRSLADALRVNPRTRAVRWPPGERPCYSNEGYLLAGLLLEKLTGRPFDDAMRDLVTGPLGMTTAAFRLEPALRPLLASGYGLRQELIPYEEDMLRPAAGLVLSARDALPWLDLWLGRGTVEGKVLLSAGGIARMEVGETLDGPDDRHGLGLRTWQSGGFVGRGHQGSTFGFQGAFRYLPREGVAWAVLTNSSSDAALHEVEDALLALVTRGVPPSAPEPAAALGEAERAGLAGFWRNDAPGEEITAPVDRLGGIEIAERPDGLARRRFDVDSPRALLRVPAWQPVVPVGGGALRGAGEAVSSVVRVRTAAGEDALLTADGLYVRSSGAAAAAGRALLALGLFLAVTGLLAAPAWAVAWLRAGRPASLAFATLLPALPPLALAAAWALRRWSPELLGRRDATSVAIWLLGWAFGILSWAALAGVLAVPWRAAGIVARLHGLAVTLGCSGLAAFAWRAGWIGLRTWRW